MNFPGGPMAKDPPASAGDLGLIPVPRRFHMPWGNKAYVPQLLKLECPWAFKPQWEKSL